LGQTLWGRTPGICLNEKGKQEAERLANGLNGTRLHAIYSSPLERAVETAEAIARRMKLDVQKNHAINEIEFGDWTGKSLEALSSDERWHRFNSHRSMTVIPRGESFLDVQNRIVEELGRLAEEHGDARVAIVSHADVIKAAVSYFVATSIDLLQRLEIPPCSVSVIEMSRESSQLIEIKNQEQLSPALVEL